MRQDNIKSPSINLFPLLAIALLSFGSMAMLFPVVPPFADSLGADVTQVGFLVSLQLYVAAALVVPVGMLSDRIGRRKLLIAGICLNFASFLAYLYSSNLGILAAARILGGLSNGALFPATSTLVVDMVPPEKRGQAMGSLTTASQAGSMLGPAAGGFILKHAGFQAVFLAAAVGAAVSLAVCLIKIRGRQISAAPVTNNKATFAWLINRRVLAGLLAISFIMFGLASVNTFLPLYGREIAIGVDRVGLIIATLYLGSVLTRLLGGWLSDRTGRSPVMLVGLGLGSAGIFFISEFATEAPLHLAGFLFGLGMGLALPASAALLADIAPFHMRGLALGLYSLAFFSGQAIAATGLGLVAPWIGFNGMYLATSIGMGAALVAVFVLTRKKSSLAS